MPTPSVTELRAIGLAHYELGRHLEETDPDRSRHLVAAREAVKPVGAARLVAMVGSALGTGALGA